MLVKVMEKFPATGGVPSKSTLSVMELLPIVSMDNIAASGVVVPPSPAPEMSNPSGKLIKISSS